MTAKKKTIDLLEQIIATHKILMDIHGELPALVKLDAQIQSLIDRLKA